MRWPWVRRSKLNTYRRLYNDAAAQMLAAEKRAIAAEAASEVLGQQLAKSELERTSVTTKLIRVGFGVHPFAEDEAQSAPTPAPQSAPESVGLGLGPEASPQEVQLAFTREAMEMYGGDLRKISRHVETRQREYYAHRERPAVVSKDELLQAQRVTEDLERALEEGRRSVQEGN